MVSDRILFSATDDKAWNTAHSDADHSVISTPADHNEEKPIEMSFALSLTLFELVCLFFFALKFEIPSLEDDNLDTVSTISYYPLFLDVHVMIFVGFGFLMTFLHKYSLSAVSLNFIIGALSLQWGVIVVTMAHQIGDGDFKTKILDIPILINGDFAAAAVLISFGALLGKTTPTQMVWMTFFEIIIYGLNEYLIIETLEVTDAGGSIVIHTFGAFFGLAVSYMLGVPSASEQEHCTSRYHSDVFAMIGTLFLFIYWPSFNAALVSSKGFQQERAVISTVLSITASCASAFATSKILSHSKKIDMVHVQNATLAGGVAMGTSCNLAICPEAAITIGIIVGIVSTIGYCSVSPHMEQEYRLSDTCGILNLHAIPGLIGGFAGAMVIFSTSDDFYGNSLTSVFDARTHRSASEQGWYQLLAVVVSATLATLSGLLIGLFLRSKQFRQQRLQYEDHEWFHVPDECYA
ncbi:ammonium transporter rh type c [Plasmopara halstedii]|uniref:Ammonium transporter rh type c n=1 Tax=Plasmopara halstedii TaxID=4781 RepID=A0A0P1ANH1_PLAHL|nr:ammonium transporter rh type c [Plasmopara halstedii]CEG42601.1 ammonium transporter rh type c [Plasmopara halstedii]|eukprot:XP_024578970.1 ammonium transporter rh type c [Plasmopara halstedii]